MSQPVFAGQKWIENMPFVELSDQEVLQEVSRRVSAVRAGVAGVGTRGKTPLVVLDLDSTLYEVRPRTLKIIREWVKTDDAQREHSVVSQAFADVGMDQLGYSLKDAFRGVSLGLDSAPEKAAFESLRKFWMKRFFSSQYLPADHAYAGSSEWVREIYSLGAKIVYLTGRDEPGMGDGTRANLVRDLFPWGDEGIHLYMKARFELPDLEHKQNAARWIHEHGVVVASFENEPPNVVALAREFPDAMNVFVDTICSDHPAPLCDGLFRLRGFEK